MKENTILRYLGDELILKLRERDEYEFPNTLKLYRILYTQILYIL